jgi:hypothetical protein
MTLPIAVELPAPRTTPIDCAAQMLPKLSRAERPVVQEALGQREVFLAVRSRGRADTGGWLGRRRVWAFALAQELVLVAMGKSPYAEGIPFTDLHESVYNAVTGELSLAPAHHVRVRRLKMAPRDGYQMLAQIYANTPPDAPS